MLKTLEAKAHCRFKKVIISCILLTQGLVSSGGPTATLGPMFRSCRPKAVEQPSSWSWANGHQL